MFNPISPPLQVRTTTPLPESQQILQTVAQGGSVYWSGLNTRLTINDIFIPEIVAIEWSMMESVSPRKGYANYTAALFLHGSRIVQGNFSLNFVRPNYLFDLLDTSIISSKRNQSENRRVISPALASKIQRREATVDDFLGFLSSNSVTTRNTNSQSTIDPTLLRQAADLFNAAAAPKQPSILDESRRRASMATSKLRTASNLNATITYGVVEGDELRANEPARVPRSRQTGGSPISTIHATEQIIGLHITGVSRVIADDGKPLMEVYSFMAQDIR